MTIVEEPEIGSAKQEPSGPGPQATPPFVATSVPHGYFESIHAFLETVCTVIDPRLAAVEERLRAEMASLRGGAAPIPQQIVYKTPIAVYAMVVLSLLLSLIALSR